jgi:hypothetical protein
MLSGRSFAWCTAPNTSQLTNLPWKPSVNCNGFVRILR